MKIKQKKKGISLVVLVITIIIMIILATTIIIFLSSNGIIDKANEAANKTNERQVQELANTAWAKAYMNGARTSDEFKTYVEEVLKNNNINLDEYNIKVTTSGVTVSRKNGEGNTEEDGDNVEEKEVWIQKADRTVVKGDTVLNIGDYVNYVSGVEGYTDTNGWQVLGAENGELLIMSATDVATKTFNSENTLEGGKAAYENGISELNEICEPYGKGAYATGARSITVEDVDRVTGYDKTQYGKGEIYEYGNVVTYTYNGTNKPSYSGSNGVSGTLSYTHSNGFYWYDLNNTYNNVTVSDLTNANNSGKELAKVKSTYYGYTASSATDLAKGTDAYKMLFGEDDPCAGGRCSSLSVDIPKVSNLLFQASSSDVSLLTTSQPNRYWLGSSYVGSDSGYAVFGLRIVYDGRVDCNSFFNSDGGYSKYVYGVRAVVSLSSNFNPERVYSLSNV